MTVLLTFAVALTFACVASGTLFIHAILTLD